MAVQFVIGRAGTGKSTFIFKQIVEELKRAPLGSPVYWIVPPQTTFETQRALAIETGVFSRCRICSFEELGQDVLEEIGGTQRPTITSQGRRLLIGHLLRNHAGELRYFAASAQHAGLADEISKTLSEFEQQGLNVLEAIDLAANALQPTASQDNALAAKLHDLRLIQLRYEQLLGQDRLDPHRRLEQILLSIARSQQLAQAQIYIDSFFDFTHFERQMIVALARKCAKVQVSLLIHPNSPVISNPHTLPDDMSVFYRTEMAHRLLVIALRQAGVKLDANVTLDQPHRFTTVPWPNCKPVGLETLERDLFSNDAKPSRDCTGIERFSCHNRASEIQAIARLFLDELRSGRRMRDLALVVRNLDDYLSLIERIFPEHNLRFFVDRRKPSMHHPLVVFLQALMRIARDGWRTSEVLRLLRTRLTDLTLGETDELENFCLDHCVDGKAWTEADPWHYERILQRGSEDDEVPLDIQQLEYIHSLRTKLTQPIGPSVHNLSAPNQTVGQMTNELRKAMDACIIPQRISAWMKQAYDIGDVQQASEHEQVLAEVQDLLDQFDQLLGPQPMTLETFIDVLESALAQFDLAVPPPAVDQIIIGELDRTRLANVHTVAVAGLAEGMFPRVGQDTGVLSDNDRTWLDRQNISLGANTTRRLLNEQSLAYFALTRATHRLIVTRPSADERGRALNPSIFWDRIGTLLPTCPLTELDQAHDAEIERLASPGRVVSAVLNWARSGASTDDTEMVQLYNWLVGSEAKSVPLSVAQLRDRVWEALSYSNPAALDAKLAQRLFRSPLNATTHRIESFASCPFQHFAGYGLNLRGRAEIDITSLDMSRLYHGVIGRLMDDAIKTGPEPDLEQQRARLPAVTGAVGEKMRHQIMLSTARNMFMLQHAQQTLEKVVTTQQKFIETARLKPSKTRVRFGPDDTIPPLSIQTPKGRTVEICGSIDRIDIAQNGKQSIVIDYSNWAGAVSLDEAYYGLAIKLLVMMLVVKEHGKKIGGKALEPVAALLSAFGRSMPEVKDRAKAEGPDSLSFHFQRDMRGIVQLDSANLIDPNLGPGVNSDILSVGLKKDGNVARPDQSDAVSADELTALLAQARKTIAQLVDELIDGKVDVRPYKLGTQTPCSNCGYRSVCRFEPGINRYHVIEPMKRTDVLARVVEENP